MGLYTKKGYPLQKIGDKVFSKKGNIIGRIKNDKVYGTDGKYVGTIVGDRLVFRKTDGSMRIGSFSSAKRMGSLRAKRTAAAIWGDEPELPE